MSFLFGMPKTKGVTKKKKEFSIQLGVKCYTLKSGFLLLHEKKKISTFFHQKENELNWFSLALGLSFPLLGACVESFCVWRPSKKLLIPRPSIIFLHSLGLTDRTVLLDFCRSGSTKPNRHVEESTLYHCLPSLKALWHQSVDARCLDADWHLNNLVALSGFLHLHFLSLWGIKHKSPEQSKQLFCLWIMQLLELRSLKEVPSLPYWGRRFS